MTESRKTLLCAGVYLAVMSLCAWWMRSPEELRGRTRLAWTTDPNPARETQIERFNALHPECLLAIDADSHDSMKVIVQCSAGMGPDLIDGILYETNLGTFVDAGILLDITEAADAGGFGVDTLHPSVRPLVQQRVLTQDDTVEWRQFTYPCNVSPTFLFYNKKLFRDAGMPEGPPEDMTWDDYIALARRIDNRSADPRTRVFGAAGVPTEQMLFDYDAAWFNPSGTRSLLASDAAFAAWKRWHELIYLDAIEPTPEQQKSVASQGGWGAGYMNWFSEGRVGMLWGARWMLVQFRRFQLDQQRQRDAWLARNPGAGPDEGPQVIEFGCVAVPRPAGGRRSTMLTARATGVNAAGDNTGEALKFIRFLAGPEYSETVNETADGNPGNRAYNTLELFNRHARPGEEDAHRLALESLEWARVRESSPFVSNAAVNRVFLKIQDKLKNTPVIADEELRRLLQSGADEIDRMIRTNIEREPRLGRMYRVMLAEGAEPVTPGSIPE